MTRARFLGLCVLFLVVATGVRAWNLETQSLWFDEGIAWHAATQPNLAAALVDDPTNPPLYFALLFSWVRLVGDSELAMRVLSLLQGLLLVSLMGFAGRRWFGQPAGILALALGALTPLLWWASQEIRMYTQLGLLGLLTALGLIEVLGRQRPAPRWAWVTLIACELGALYSHNTGIVALGAVNLVAGFSWLLPALHRIPDWRFAARWVGGQTLVVVLWLPEMLTRFANVGADNAATLKPPSLSLELLWQSWQALWASSWEMVRANPPELQTLALLLLPLLAMALATLFDQRGRVLLGLIASLYLILIVALGIIGVDLHGRYLVMIVPLLLVAVAGGITEVSRRPFAWISPVAAVVAVGIAWLLLPGKDALPYQHDQARELTAYYAESLGPDDLVLAWTYAERYDLMYYWDRLRVQARRIELPEGADAAEVQTLINLYLLPDKIVRVERSVWFMQGADARGMLPCLLGQSQIALPDTYVVNGLASTGYNLEGPLQLPTFDLVSSADFGTLRLVAAALPQWATPSSQPICLPLELEMQRATTEDLRVALRVLTPYGNEFAAADAPLMTVAQVPTSRLQAGDHVEAYALLSFPQGTPPGSYELRLRVYSELQPSGLDVLAAGSAPLGKDVTLGQVNLAAGTWPPFEGDCAVEIGAGIQLTNCAALPTDPLQPGQMLNLNLDWQIDDASQPITLALAGEGWRASDTSVPPGKGAVLDWRQLRIPADARGTARLTARAGAGDAAEIGVYILAQPEIQLTAPEVAYPSGITLTGLGTLYGFSAQAEISSGETPFDVTLVWQAEGPTPTAYTVTVQLLDPSGHLLAQHDSVPADGTRLTTGWQPGEFIVDSHALRFREDAQNYSGPAKLIMAVYDPASGTRLTAPNGADYIMLLENVLVTRS